MSNNIMKNADMPAMPQTVTDSSDGSGLVGSHMEDEWSGLTKREMLAMHAMQGITGNGFDDYTSAGWAEGIARDAVKLADALLVELEK